MSNSRPLVATAVLGVIGGIAFALTVSLTAAPPVAPQLNVTTTIADFAGGFPLRLQSDRQGAYVTTSVGKNVTVKSVIDSFSNGSDWSLTTYYVAKGRGDYGLSDRRVFLDLSEQLAMGGFATPSLGTGQVTAQVFAKCSRVNVDYVGMTLGSTALCPGLVRFLASDGNWYRLAV